MAIRPPRTLIELLVWIACVTVPPAIIYLLVLFVRAALRIIG